MAGVLIPIASTTLSTSATSVSFSSIPQTYKDVFVKMSARSDRANSATVLAIRFNGDASSATTYSNNYVRGDGNSTIVAGIVSNSNSVASSWVPGATATASVFSSAELYIPNYTSAAYKPVSLHSILENNNTTAYCYFTAGLFNSNTAVTSIEFYLPATAGESFVAGSTFTLYGVK